MSRFNHPLSRVRIAAPCKADWEQMIGTERVRFCGQCNLNVYNLSSMTRPQAESLIVQTEGRLCVRFYRRRDGSILTDNCPVGLRKIRRRLSSLARSLSAAVLSFAAGLGVYRTVAAPPPWDGVMGALPVYTGEGMDAPSPVTPVYGMAEVGELPLNLQSSQDRAERRPRRRAGKSRTVSTR
jgi:hypothetical protein